jgi:hypothetical protein
VKDSFMSELANFLTDESKKIDHPASLFSPYNFSHKMVREYVQWIGLLSSSKDGLKLLCQFKIFQHLRAFVRKDGKRDHFLAVVLFSLEYRHPGETRDLL